MNTHDKLIAAAKRAARGLAREGVHPYQRALDVVAAGAGRKTWKAFLADPVPVDADSATAAAEPDYSAVPGPMHMATALAYGDAIGAQGMVATPRAWDDARPVLRYVVDGREHGVDARGLDLRALGMQVLGPDRHGQMGHSTATRVLPVVDGRRLQADVMHYELDGVPTATIAMSLQGGRPPAATRPWPETQDRGKRSGASLPAIGPLRRRVRALMGGDARETMRRLARHGPLSTTEGPVVGGVGGKTLRLRPGHGLMVFAPPGTGRIAGVVVPALVTDDASSYLVHDDGQALELTSGWRAMVGRVAVVRTDQDGSDAFNPLDREWLPSDARAAEGHVHSVMMIISDGNASLARVMTHAAMTLVRAEGGTTLREVRRQLEHEEDRVLADMAAALLTPLVTDSMHRSFGRNTIVPADLRGRATQGGRPLTLYLVRGDRTERRDVMVAVVQSVVWRWTLSYGPGEDMGAHGVNGPCAFVSMLTDLHRLPVIPGISTTLDLQRAKRHSTIITSAAGTAIEERYGREEALRMRQCCSVRLAAHQSDPGDMPFVDPYDQLGYGALSQMRENEGYLLTQRDMPPLRIVRKWFFHTRAMLERSYNPRTRKGPRPVE